LGLIALAIVVCAYLSGVVTVVGTGLVFALATFGLVWLLVACGPPTWVFLGIGGIWLLTRLRG
jgi:hypothetical protein